MGVVMGCVPPVPPTRTSSRLETTFDSNCGVVTKDLSGGSMLLMKTAMPEESGDLGRIRPMEPIVMRRVPVPPPYSEVVRDGRVYPPGQVPVPVNVPAH
ncbi:unnamed protein product, partial [Anisakis simplex]|uniref:Secreted protein n=1 Tax=Anisakis simplex TaxID=6269 RepID=A0A0M3JP37_ANISI